MVIFTGNYSELHVCFLQKCEAPKEPELYNSLFSIISFLKPDIFPFSSFSSTLPFIRISGDVAIALKKTLPLTTEVVVHLR